MTNNWFNGTTPTEIHSPNFGETFRTVPMPKGASRKEAMYIIHRDGFMLLAMGYNGKKALEIKLAYIAAFNAMEEHIHNPQLIMLHICGH